MKTKAQVTEWLETANPIRVILIEISGVYDGAGNILPTFYLSNRPFGAGTTATAGVPANQLYQNCIVGGVTFTESVDFNGQPSIGYGDIEIDNTDGSRDDWLQYIWTNKSVNVYIGDASWPREDFYLIFSGLIKDIDTRSRTSLNFILVNKLQILNEPASITIIGGNTAKADQLVPLCFGECFNITPVLIDSANLQYQVHNGPVEQISQVRDNGAPIAFTPQIATGKFVLNASPFGTITCTVQGAKPVINTQSTYVSKIAQTIKHLLNSYGKQIADTEINTTNFTSFDANMPREIGVYLPSRENVLDICQRLANSAASYLVTDISGKFKLISLVSDTSSVTISYSVEPKDMEQRSLTISQKLEVETTVKIGYSKNWTVQTNGLASVLSPEAVSILDKEYYYITKTDSTLASRYQQVQEPQSKDTLLVDGVQADTEATKLLNIKKQPRFVYTANYFGKMLFCELGDFIKVTHPRFGLSSGKIGMAVSVNRDWLNGRATIGVFI